MRAAILAKVPSLEALSNIAVIGAALLVSVVWLRSASETRPVGGVDTRYLYSVGETVSTDTGLAFDAPLTAVLFVHSQCQFCTRSMAFYTRLLEARNSNRSETRIIAIAKEPKESLDGYLRTHSLELDAAVALDFNSPFRLQLTPTLLLVERGGRIDELWAGQLTPEQEALVLKRVVGSDGGVVPATP